MSELSLVGHLADFSHVLPIIFTCAMEPAPIFAGRLLFFALRRKTNTDCEG